MKTASRAEAGEVRGVARLLRRWIIEQSLDSGVGHIASALSIADVVAALWGSVLHEPGTDHPDRDRFILSKGHAALALYAALRWKGIIDEATFRTFCKDGSSLGVHPEHALAGVEVSTGSLGLGLSIGCGIAYGLRSRGVPSRVFVLLSDAECNEGQIWEAAMFAGHHKLHALTVIVDRNRFQALGRTEDVLDVDLPAIWSAFGWDVAEVDGHDVGRLEHELAAVGPRPRAVIADTVLGKGVPFMENRLEWHYRNLTPELAAEALRSLEGPE